MRWLSKLLLLSAASLVLAAGAAFFSGGSSSDATTPARTPSAFNSPTDGLIRRLQSRLQTNGGDADGLEQLGFAYLQKARETGDPSLFPKAEAVFQDALILRPNDQQALIGLSSVALNRHDFTAALALAERALAAADPTAAVYGAVGDAQIELGHYQEAVDAFQQMVNLRPDLASYVRVSYAREIYGDIDGAVEAMQMAVEAGGFKGENADWTRVQLGNLYFNRGDPHSAEAQYEAALQAFPGYVHAIAGQGRVAAASGDYATAEALYQQAADRMPIVQYVVALGDVFEAGGKHEEAQRQYDLVQAIDQLYQANGVNTDLEIALLYADHDTNIERAVTQAQAVYDGGPSVPAADALAWALYKSGDAVTAKPYITEALRLGTQDAAIHYHAGLIHKALGDNDAARAALQKALDINPTFSVLQAPLAEQALEETRE
jgi:tetratricopeptide (TPR) repeat protein